MKTFAFTGGLTLQSSTAKPTQPHHTAPAHLQPHVASPSPWEMLPRDAECAETEPNQENRINTSKRSSFSLSIIHGCLQFSFKKSALKGAQSFPRDISSARCDHKALTCACESWA